MALSVCCRLKQQDNRIIGATCQKNLVSDQRSQRHHDQSVEKNDRKNVCESNLSCNSLITSDEVKAVQRLCNTKRVADNHCSEKSNLLMMKYDKGKQKSLTVKNVCFNLLKINLFLHNKFVSFCCYNNTNKSHHNSNSSSTGWEHNETIMKRSNQEVNRKRGSTNLHRGVGGSSVVVIMQLCLFLLTCLSIISNVESFQSCPSICTCKWKNGKTTLFFTYS